MILIIIAVILFIGIFYFLKLNSPEYKGVVGESIIAKYLGKLPENEYVVFNDVYLGCGDNSIQIDHLVVSIYGIFVIETKNYSGWIFGSEKNNYWTQIIFSRKTKFRNPIKQNKSHVNSLGYLLKDFGNLQIFSIIVFTGSAELKKIDSITPVIYENELYSYILRSKDEQIINNEQMKNIVCKISENMILDKEIKKTHIHNITKKRYTQEQKTNSLICPKCNGSLIVRNGPYGKFYGCTNYPTCKFTQTY